METKITNVISGKFNEKITFEFSWHSEFIYINDDRIDPEKKNLQTTEQTLEKNWKETRKNTIYQH